MELFKLLGTIAIETQGVNEAINNVVNQAEQAGNEFDTLDNKSKNLSNGGFSILKGAAANLIAQGFSKLVSFTTDLIKSSVDYSSSIEQYTTSFETMTGSAEKAADVTARLQQIGAATPFELPQLADTTQLLMNYGFTADGAIDSMMMLGDISQGSSEKMSRIASAYGQMSSAGKVSLEDVKQMIEAGFNPLQEITDTTGESMESLYDRISKGTISVDEITASMVRSTSEGGKYFGAMDAQSKTLSGRMSTLSDTANETIGNIIGPLLVKFSDEWLPKITEKVSELDEKWQSFMQWISDNKEDLAAIGTIIGVVTVAIVAQSAAQAAKIAMNAAEVTSLGALIAAKLASAAATMAALAPYIAVTAAIAAVIAIIVLCVKHWDEIKEKVVEVASNIVEKVQEMRDNVKEKIENMVSSAKAKFEDLKANLKEKVAAIKSDVVNKFQEIKDGITEKIETARDKVHEAIEKIKSFFDFEWELPQIKLPHFEKIGTTELGLPKIGVKWYAKGGVLEKPTIFGMNGNALMGGGEAGKEAVAPIDVLQGYVAEAVAAQNNGVVAALERILDTLMDIDENMGGNLREALDGTALKINNREFGRLVRTVNV